EDAAGGWRSVDDHAYEDEDRGDGRLHRGIRLDQAAYAVDGTGSFGHGRHGPEAHADTSSRVDSALGAMTVLLRRWNQARTRSDCSRQMTMMTMALNAGVAEDEMPRYSTVLSRVAISRAPTNAPESENLPPISDAPPITTARIASSSSW